MVWLLDLEETLSVFSVIFSNCVFVDMIVQIIDLRFPYYTRNNYNNFTFFSRSGG